MKTKFINFSFCKTRPLLIGVIISLVFVKLSSAQEGLNFVNYKCATSKERVASLKNVSNSVGLIHKNDCEVGNCTEISTGVLLNNTARDGRLLFLTYSRPGWSRADYKNATIVFNRTDKSCESSVYTDKYLEFKENHKVLYENTIDKYVLLELKADDLNYEISDDEYSKLYFSGWKKLYNPTKLEEAYLLHFGGSSRSLKVSYTNSIEKSNFIGDLGVKDNFIIKKWSYGKIDDHALGAPLISKEGFFLGMFRSKVFPQQYNIFRIDEDLVNFLDPLKTEVKSIYGSRINLSTTPLTVDDFTLVSETDKIYNFPNQKWDSTVDETVLPDFNVDRYFLEKNTLGTKEGIHASVISGSAGTAKLRMFQYIKTLPEYGHPDGNTVKGTQLYATGTTSVFNEKYYNFSLGEDDVITNGDLGLLMVGATFVRKISTDFLRRPAPRFWSNPLVYGALAYFGDVSRLGIGKFWQGALTTGLRAPTNRADEKYLLFKIFYLGLDANVAPLVPRKLFNPFPGTNMKTLLQLELKNSKCKAINVPGLGKYNALELFKPDAYKSVFIETSDSDNVLADLNVTEAHMDDGKYYVLNKEGKCLKLKTATNELLWNENTDVEGTKNWNICDLVQIKKETTNEHTLKINTQNGKYIAVDNLTPGILESFNGEDFLSNKLNVVEKESSIKIYNLPQLNNNISNIAFTLKDNSKLSLPYNLIKEQEVLASLPQANSGSSIPNAHSVKYVTILAGSLFAGSLFVSGTTYGVFKLVTRVGKHQQLPTSEGNFEMDQLIPKGDREPYTPGREGNSLTNRKEASRTNIEGEGSCGNGQ